MGRLVTGALARGPQAGGHTLARIALEPLGGLHRGLCQRHHGHVCRRQRCAQGCARMPDATVLCHTTGPSQQGCWSQGQEPAQAGRVLPAPGWRETPAAGGEAMACDRPRQDGS